MLRVVRETDPPTPSTRLSTASGAAALAANRGVKPKELAALVRGELDWVVMKALEKDRTRRYETAAGLAADVERSLAGDAVAAAPPSAAYRLRKLARLNRAALTAGLAVALALLAGAGAAGWQAVRATRAEGRAEAKYAVARQVVDDMYTQVAEKWLAHDGALTPVQRELLEKALAFYDEAAGERPGDEAALLDAARARKRVARIHRKLGRYLEAEAAYRQLIEYVEPYAARHPDQPEHRVDLGHFHVELGAILLEVGRPWDAVPALTRAVAIHEELAASDPGPLADSLLALGQGYSRLSRRADAEQALTRGRDLFERLAAANPTAAGYRLRGAQFDAELGNVLRATGRLPDAERAFGRAVTTYEGLLAAGTTTDFVRSDLAVTLANLSQLRAQTGHSPEGVESLRRAIGLLEGLAKQHPHDQHILGTLANVEALQVRLLVAFGRQPDAVLAGLRAVDRAERAAKTLPPAGGFRGHYMFLLVVVADLLAADPGQPWHDPGRAVTLAGRAAELRDAEVAWQSLAWARYRAGDWRGCLEALVKQQNYSANGDFVGAMANWRLGDREEARAVFDRADRWLAGYTGRWKQGLYPVPDMFRRLRDEAAALLEAGEPTRELAPPPRAADPGLP
jgi:tetratricopeptide (TPR) repeat protein